MQLIDTHTHLFGEAFETDLETVVNNALLAGVGPMLLPNIDSQSIAQVANTVQKFDSTRPMWGLHPCHVFDNWKDEMAAIEPMFAALPAVAVGEIGLDFYWSKEFALAQKEALLYQLELANALKLPVSLHTREATRESIDLVKPFVAKGLRGVFHCFSGTKEEALAIVEMGFALGIGGSLTFKNNILRSFVAHLPLTSLVLETDAPYLAPVPYRGKRNEPAYVRHVAVDLASLMNLDLQTVASQTSLNARQIFNL